MSARRLAVFGLVIFLAVVIGVLARREVMDWSGAPEAPAVTAETPPKTVAPMAEDPAQPGAPAMAPTRPTFDVVRVEPRGDAIIAGRAAPGSEVELLANGGVIDRTKANESGEFVMMPPPLEPGNHELTLKTPESSSRQAVTVSVPQPDKGEVLVVVGEPGKPSQVVQAGAPDKQSTGALSQVPGLLVEPAAQTTPLRIGAVEAEDGRLFVQGSGPPGSRVMIYLNDAPLTEARIGTDGRWSLTVEKGLAAGSYTVRADQTGADGKVLARAEVPFTAEAPAVAAVPAPSGPAASAPSSSTSPPTASAPSASAPPALASKAEPETTGTANPVVPKLATVEVRRGDNLWRISRRAYGAGTRFSTIYEANANQIRDPNRIYPGQIFVMPGG
jgi:nucleoid-associated protein YgaU